MRVDGRCPEFFAFTLTVRRDAERVGIEIIVAASNNNSRYFGVIQDVIFVLKKVYILQADDARVGSVDAWNNEQYLTLTFVTFFENIPHMLDSKIFEHFTYFYSTQALKLHLKMYTWSSGNEL